MAAEYAGAENKGFGSCCQDLKEVLDAEDFEPLFYVGDDSILYMSVGVLDTEDEEDAGFLDHPVYCCPFCGKRLQTPEEVDAKSGDDDA